MTGRLINPKLEWLWVYLQGEIMAESRRWVLNVIISIVLKMGWFSYVRVFLKQDEYHIYSTQLALFTIPLKTFKIIFNEMAVFLFWFSGDVFREHEQMYLWPRETQVLRNNLWTVQFSLKASKFLGGHGFDIWILKYFSEEW